jgi:hypothetical protein
VRNFDWLPFTPPPLVAFSDPSRSSPTNRRSTSSTTKWRSSSSTASSGRRRIGAARGASGRGRLHGLAWAPRRHCGERCPASSTRGSGAAPGGGCRRRGSRWWLPCGHFYGPLHSRWWLAIRNSCPVENGVTISVQLCLLGWGYLLRHRLIQNHGTRIGCGVLAVVFLHLCHLEWYLFKM